MSTVSKSCSADWHTATFILLFLVSPGAHVGDAADSISTGQSLSGNQTVVSKEGIFVLGFFSPGNSSNYYVGIWFKKIPGQTVVWVANREAPISNPSTSELRISEGGNLILLNQSNFPVWSSNSSRSTSPTNSVVAVLLDDGNLVIREQSNSSVVIWQSFDHPTDTWLPGGWLGLNKATGEYQYLRSWKNTENPAPGPFSYHIDERGSSQFLLWWNGSVSYWTTGAWTGQFRKMPEVKSSRHFNFSYVDDGQRRGYTYSVMNLNFAVTRGTLDANGRINLLVWFPDAADWQQVWAEPVSRCDVYSVCGAFSVCNEKSLTLCECLQGFEPASVEDWELGDWSGGCATRNQLHCGPGSSRPSGGKDVFLAMPGVRLPNNSQALAPKSKEECELACLEDCNCSAYAYGSGCSVWKGPLRNAVKLTDGNTNAQTPYVRLPSSELPTSTSGHAKIAIGVIMAVVLGAAILLFAAFGLICGFQRRSHDASRLAAGPLVTFTYANLQQTTNNFSERLGGGGFGSVFRGTLTDSTTVAVKKLELEGSAQGEKQFRTELGTLGTIHHVNLVRLLGFCAEGSRKLLVYEHMPNGSLDAHLFGGSSSALTWSLRYQIILGVARGLAYLHEKCREGIIHCDIKPENILLDAQFQPKVSDFGLAKLLGRDFSRVLTTMRGTVGYLAPEWLSGLPVTAKADVYSYGMLVFEIISGRRNRETYQAGGVGYFPVWAAIQVNEGQVLGLLDERLEGVADEEQLTRACKVACWCIQGCEEHRPSMSQVVQILEGVFQVSTPPVPWSLQHLVVEEESASASSSAHLCAVVSSGSASSVHLGSVLRHSHEME